MRLIAILLLAGTATARAEGSVAFLGMHMLDDSLQTSALGQDPAELDRLAMLEEMVRERFAEEGFDLIDTSPAQAEIDRVANPAKCQGCDARIARDLGADYALVGEVQKVSDLILAMNLQLRDAESGETVRGGVADIRGNTDETWARGMRYILDNRIFREESQ
jgi:hypothetical protein